MNSLFPIILLSFPFPFPLTSVPILPRVLTEPSTLLTLVHDTSFRRLIHTFRFSSDITPQRVFRHWLAFYLVTFRSTYVIDVPFYYILHMYLLRFPSQVLVNTPSSLTHILSSSIDRRPYVVKSD